MKPENRRAPLQWRLRQGSEHKGGTDALSLPCSVPARIIPFRRPPVEPAIEAAAVATLIGMARWLANHCGLEDWRSLLSSATAASEQPERRAWGDA